MLNLRVENNIRQNKNNLKKGVLVMKKYSLGIFFVIISSLANAGDLEDNQPDIGQGIEFTQIKLPPKEVETVEILGYLPVPPEVKGGITVIFSVKKEVVEEVITITSDMKE